MHIYLEDCNFGNRNPNLQATITSNLEYFEIWNRHGDTCISQTVFEDKLAKTSIQRTITCIKLV